MPLPFSMPPLAQSSTPTGQILLWVFVLIVVIVLGGLAVMELRRRLLSRDDASKAVGLMEEMRGLHARGELSDEEYDRVRKRMAARAAGRDPDELAPAPRMPDAGEVRAKPGYDLTGEKLPGGGPGDSSASDDPAGDGPQTPPSG